MLSAHAQLLSNGTASSAATFWAGGFTIFSVVSSNFNSSTVALYVLGPDGATYLPIANASFTANGISAVLYLAPGQYQAQVSGGTPAGVFATLDRVPD